MQRSEKSRVYKIKARNESARRTNMSNETLTEENTGTEETGEEQKSKSRSRYQSPEERLLRAQVAIENAMNDAQILAELANYGYDRTRLEAGMALYNEARDMVARQRAIYGEQYDSTSAINTSWEEADNMYMKTLRIARLVFKDDRLAQAGLMLNGERKRSFHGWAGQALTFYRNLVERNDWITAMSEFGYTEEKIQTEHEVVETLLSVNAKQEMHKGLAQTTTELRDNKLNELDEWVGKFKSVTKIALDDHRQWLEKLGMGAV
jgi:hypothetical protein